MRVLLVTSRFPLPPWRGNQVRTLEWLQALHTEERGLVCPSPGRVGDERRMAAEGVEIWTWGSGLPGRLAGLSSSLASGRPAQEGLYASASARRAVSRALAAHRPDAAIVQMVRCGWALEQIRRESPSTRVVFDAIDAMGLHFERAARLAPRALRPLLAAEARRSGRRERVLASRADLAIAVSRRDVEALGPAGGRVVPVSGRAIEPDPAVVRAPQVLLSGNLGYRPTVQGALWFARQVWPAVVGRLPEARWVLAGARPARRVRDLVRLPGVEVHADVDELDRFLLRASVAIAPMASGSGVPMKVLEAWSAGLPVVAHPWTAEGVDPGAREAMRVAGPADEWQDAVVELLSDPVAARALAKRGRRAWLGGYSPNRVADRLRDALREAFEGAG